MKAVDEINNENCIICGDFNLVLDPDLDYHNYKNVNNKKAREKILEIIQEKYLIDPFRENNPVTKKVHMEKTTTISASKIRFFPTFGKYATIS